MWEIEDKSGTEIVELFYKNLLKGYTKSVALKKARTAFLEKADKLRSHPYFWSAMVVYGNNTSIINLTNLRLLSELLWFCCCRWDFISGGEGIPDIRDLLSQVPVVPL